MISRAPEPPPRNYLLHQRVGHDGCSQLTREVQPRPLQGDLLRLCQAALIALALFATACSSSPGLPTPPPLTVVAASPTSSPETAAQPTPTTVSVAAAPTSPPVPTPVPVPTAVPSPTARPDLLVVTNAGTEGVSIRRAPATGERIKTWSDGAEMVSLLEEQQAGGRSWKKVRDPDG